ncbi:uncharacterized protein LOC109813542 [Cajanus cajan]|uniref:uncharacterized protein LOC109813542 n=1 Tax=Cajanus cajan TaxID=3821 RepID=UPI0010FB1F38|nr:uncharacterized protein LOC109813542 [Cajanus cajan]
MEEALIQFMQVNPKEYCQSIITRRGTVIGKGICDHLRENKDGVDKDKSEFEPESEKEAELNKENLPYAHAPSKKDKERQFTRFLDIIKRFHINIPFAEALEQMPSYTRFMKELLTKKRKLSEDGTVELERIGEVEVKPTRMTLQLADRSIKYPHGIVEYLLVKVDKFLFLVDFVVMDIEEDSEVPLILGRPFMKTAKVIIDVDDGKLKVRLQDDEVNFNIFEAMKHPNDKKDYFRVDVMDEVCLEAERKSSLATPLEKELNFDIKATSEKRKLQLHELEEMQLQAYESSKIYKSKVKSYHDKKIVQRNFQPGQQILLFNFRLRLLPGKFKSKWSGPFVIKSVKPYGVVELEEPNSGRSWMVNGQRIKPYLGGEVEKLTIVTGSGSVKGEQNVLLPDHDTHVLGVSFHASSLSFGHDPKTVMTTLCFFRFWLGFGIGGDYPLSATIMSEYANKKTRGAFIAAVFAMQGFGILVGGVFAIVIAFVFFKTKFSAPPYEVDPLGSTVPQADYVWRIILMAGALPAALTYYWRLKMPETARYTALVAKNMEQAATDMSKVMQVEIQVEPETEEKAQGQYGLLSKEFLTRHGLHLLGTTSTWFLLDIAFYSQNLFQKDIFSAIGWIPSTKTMNALEEVFRIARAQTLIALCSTVPGYWFTVAFIDRIGRFIIQLMGFFFMTVFMYTLAIPYDYWTLKENRIGFVVLYSLTFFFANFGPNATTFVVPAEIFPARFRSTCHGISSASGKLGAMVGAFGFLYLAQNQDKSKTDAGYPAGIGVKNSLIVLGVVNILGFLFTFLVPEAKGRSLEDISGENEEVQTNKG